MINIIKECYSECPRTQQLHQDFAGYSLDQCVDNIMENLNKLEDYEFIQFKENDELVGYFVTTESEGNYFMPTFFVRPKFRTKEYLTKFWNRIKEEFSGDFMSMVYSTNEPGKGFLRKNSKFEKEIDKVTYFIF